jgi:MFS family permease
VLRAPVAVGVDPQSAPIAIRETTCPRRRILSEVQIFTVLAIPARIAGAVGLRNRTQERALVVLAVGMLDLGLEQAIVAPALPAIERHYHTSPQSGTWLLSGFLLAAAVAIPLAGRLGDMFGRRTMLLASLGLFALGALICALASSIGLVIAGRVIQGLGAGVGPLALALARDHLPAARLTTAVGVLVAAGSVGSVVGLLLSGVLVDHVSVPAIFWVLFAVAVMLALLVSTVVPGSRPDQTGRLDVLGALLLGGALGSGAVAISQGNTWGWGSVRTAVGLILALALLGAFVVRERRAAAPLLDPAAMALRSVWSANVAMGGLGFSLLIASALVPLIGAYPKLTGYGLGLSTTQIALVLVPASLATLVAGPLGGRLVPRTGARVQALCGTLLATVTYVALALLTPSVTGLALATIPLGIGVGLALGAITDLVALASPREQSATTLGVNVVIRVVATALGTQVAIAVVTAAPSAFPAAQALATHIGTSHLPPRVLAALAIPAYSGFRNAFWMAAAASVVALLAVTLTPSRRTDPALMAATK